MEALEFTFMRVIRALACIITSWLHRLVFVERNRAMFQQALRVFAKHQLALLLPMAKDQETAGLVVRTATV